MLLLSTNSNFFYSEFSCAQNLSVSAGQDFNFSSLVWASGDKKLTSISLPVLIASVFPRLSWYQLVDFFLIWNLFFFFSATFSGTKELFFLYIGFIFFIFSLIFYSKIFICLNQDRYSVLSLSKTVLKLLGELFFWCCCLFILNFNSSEI